MRRILELARLLNLDGGAVVRLAGDIAHNRQIRGLGDLTQAQRAELELFLERAAAAERKLEPARAAA